jgi:hypothetical protein
MTPFLIVSGTGTPIRGHRRPCLTVDTSADTPAYVPSKAVVGGAGVCAATGVANVKATNLKTIFTRPDTFPPYTAPLCYVGQVTYFFQIGLNQPYTLLCPFMGAKSSVDLMCGSIQLLIAFPTGDLQRFAFSSIPSPTTSLVFVAPPPLADTTRCRLVVVDEVQRRLPAYRRELEAKL